MNNRKIRYLTNAVYKQAVKLIVGLFLLLITTSIGFSQKTYQGVCDASAAIRIDDNHILVAEDDNDSLVLYSIESDNNIPKNTFAYIDKKKQLHKKNSDLEAVAQIGKRTYWIGSHGRNSDGEIKKKRRHKFFALDLSDNVYGKPSWKGRYVNLVDDMLDVQNWDSKSTIETETLIQLIKYSTRLKEKDNIILAPKDKGFNIEGLSVTSDLKGLYIGLRNPQFFKDAIIIHLKNPDDVIIKGESAKFGEPIFLDLDGLGIRSLSFSPTHKKFFIIAGRSDSKSDFKLFEWSGLKNEKPKLIEKLNPPKDTGPEAIIIHGDRLQILLDVGSKSVFADNGESLECKDAPKTKKTFSDIWIDIKTP